MYGELISKQLIKIVWRLVLVKIIQFLALWFLSFSAVVAQDSIYQKLTDKYWAINEYNYYIYGLTDTLKFISVPSKTAILSTKPRHGLIFHTDGTFEEILQKSCANNRDPFMGKWSIENGFIEADLRSGQCWYLLIVSLTEDKLVTKLTIMNH